MRWCPGHSLNPKFFYVRCWNTRDAGKRNHVWPIAYLLCIARYPYKKTSKGIMWSVFACQIIDLIRLTHTSILWIQQSITYRHFKTGCLNFELWWEVSWIHNHNCGNDIICSTPKYACKPIAMKRVRLDCSLCFLRFMYDSRPCCTKQLCNRPHMISLPSLSCYSLSYI